MMETNKLQYDYDLKNDSLFIYSTNEYEYDISQNISWDILDDFNKEGIPVAFEFLNASKTFDIDKKEFYNLKNIFITSNIREKEIKIHMELVIISESNNQINIGIDRTMNNLSNIPNNDYELALI